MKLIIQRQRKDRYSWGDFTLYGLSFVFVKFIYVNDSSLTYNITMLARKGY